jgi:hypothetical protein
MGLKKFLERVHCSLFSYYGCGESSQLPPGLTEDPLKSDTRARLPCDERSPFFRSLTSKFLDNAETKVRIEVTQTHWREWSEQSKFRAAMTRRSEWP